MSNGDPKDPANWPKLTPEMIGIRRSDDKNYRISELRDWLASNPHFEDERSVTISYGALKQLLSVPDALTGWQLVPVEPTEMMLYTYSRYLTDCVKHGVVPSGAEVEAYRAMLAAAPVAAPSAIGAPDPFTLELCEELFGCFLHRTHDLDHVAFYECAVCSHEIDVSKWVNATHNAGCLVLRAKAYLAKHKPEIVAVSDGESAK